MFTQISVYFNSFLIKAILRKVQINIRKSKLNESNVVTGKCEEYFGRSGVIGSAAGKLCGWLEDCGGRNGSESDSWSGRGGFVAIGVRP